jgi:hypothetical protein
MGDTEYNAVSQKIIFVWKNWQIPETRYDNVTLIPIRNPRWKQKRTEGYVIVSNQRHNSVVHIAFSVVIGGGVRLETHIPHRTQLRTISMIFTFDNKFDQTDEVDYMFIFKIKHQYSFWIIAHILFNALLRVWNRFSRPRFSHSVT